MNFLLPEHEGCTGEFGPSRGSTDRAQCGQGPILSSAAQASELRKYIIWHSDQTCLFWIFQLSRPKIHGLYIYGPSNNQSEPSDLPQEYLAMYWCGFHPLDRLPSVKNWWSFFLFQWRKRNFVAKESLNSVFMAQKKSEKVKYIWISISPQLRNGWC